MTEPLTAEELEVERGKMKAFHERRAGGGLNSFVAFEVRIAQMERWLATIDARDRINEELLAAKDTDREAIRRLEWLVGEKDKALRAARPYVADAAQDGYMRISADLAQVGAALALTVADAPKEGK